MTDRELMQMALDALEDVDGIDTETECVTIDVGEVIEALRSRLANEFNPDWNQVEALQESLREHMAEIQRLRTALAQPEPVIQARKEGDLIVVDLPQVPRGSGGIIKDEQPEPEPVGWIGYFEGNLVSFLQTQEQVNQFLENTEPVGQVFPVYAAPPKKEWQGLTEEEILEEYRQSYGDDGNLTDVYFAQAIEAKLKEKNNG